MNNRHNHERREYRGRSWRRGGRRVRELREHDAMKTDFR